MISADAESRAWVLRRVKELQLCLDVEGIVTEDLDSLVHDCASEKAAEVNNAGMPAQLAYLLQGSWSRQDIVDRAKMTKDESR